MKENKPILKYFGWMYDPGIIIGCFLILFLIIGSVVLKEDYFGVFKKPYYEYDKECYCVYKQGFDCVIVECENPCLSNWSNMIYFQRTRCDYNKERLRNE